MTVKLFNSAALRPEAVSSSSVPLRLVALRCSFGDKPVVKGINLDILGGEFFSLLGPSGCGKTTTLRMIAGLEKATSGEILLGDDEIKDVPAYRRAVHTVFQSYALFPHLTVGENVAFGLKERRLKASVIQQKVAAILELVELEGCEDLRPRQLSGGMQQRVALARALVLEPRVLLLDEPLGALDLRMRRQMQVLLKNVQHELGITFVYVTHDQDEAFSMSDRVGIMNNGVLEQVSTPQDIYHRPATLFAANFVGASNCIPVAADAPAGDGRDGYDVDAGVLGRGRVQGVGVVDNDGRATAIVRPEMVRLESPEPLEFGGTGIVEDISFLGAQTSVRLALPDGQLIQADVASRLLPTDLAVGEPTRFGWRNDDMWVVTR